MSVQIQKPLDDVDPARKMVLDKFYEAILELQRGGAGMARTQRGVITITGAVATATATLAEEVDPDTAQVRNLGQYHNQTTEAFKAYLKLETDGVTVTARRGTASSGITVISYEVTG